jgi:hypothetical protein
MTILNPMRSNTPPSQHLIRIELELAITFATLAHTRYSMGHIANGNVSRNNAEEAYRTALHYLGKLSYVDSDSAERLELMGLVKKAEEAIATLRADTTGTGPT